MNRYEVPPKRRGSRPDLSEPYSPDAFELIAKHETQIKEHDASIKSVTAAVASLAADTKLASATILQEVREIKATDRHATAKLIGAAITTIVLTVGGILGGTAAIRPSAPVTAPGPTRSALDVKLDVCRSMQPNTTGRTECMVRVASEEP